MVKIKYRNIPHVLLTAGLALTFAAGCSNNIDVNPFPESGGVNRTRSDTEQVKVLLIGSSYLGYNNFPEMFLDFCVNGNKNISISTAIEYGKYLNYHSVNQATISKINSEKWDYVILQDAPSTIGYPDNHQFIFPSFSKHDTYNAILRLDSLIKCNYSRTKTVLIMPWAFEDGLTWISGQTDTYDIMQKKIYDNTIKWSEELHIEISPVGWAFNEVIKRNKQLHYLFQNDFNHPSYKGAYLMACVLYTTIFNESCENNSYYRYLDKNEAEYFRRLASDIWREFNK